jgi:2-polyprenyl-6-methoxyphenol hydroxylase-like FAD-dependent oxidoreductase
MLQIGSNASRIMARWGDTLQQAAKMSAQPGTMTMFDKHGKVLIQPPLPTEIDGSPILYANRGALQRLMYDYAISLGIKVHFGVRVKEYFEDEHHAGVIVDGERIEGDGVIVADGIHSTARKHVIGIHQHPRTSGFAVYRSAFPLSLLANDPLTKKYAESDRDIFHVWLGTDVHAILFILVSSQTAVIFCTHKVSPLLPQNFNFSRSLDRTCTKSKNRGISPAI